jgi:DNA-binding NtrC family response regulator
VEKLVSSETLRHPGGNKAQAASLLGISARTIYRKQAPDDGEIE